MELIVPFLKLNIHLLVIIDMTYLNQFHKNSSQRKMKKIADWNSSPITYETVMQQQKRREGLAEKMEGDEQNRID